MVWKIIGTIKFDEKNAQNILCTLIMNNIITTF